MSGHVCVCERERQREKGVEERAEGLTMIVQSGVAPTHHPHHKPFMGSVGLPE
jgi:hypothetical protein